VDEAPEAADDAGVEDAVPEADVAAAEEARDAEDVSALDGTTAEASEEVAAGLELAVENVPVDAAAALLAAGVELGDELEAALLEPVSNDPPFWHTSS
jgi:hypothetical protein